MARPPLLVVALGGNAVSPPRGGLTFAVERELIAQAAAELAALAIDARLLIVHGNGPQVGRLLIAERADAGEDLDLLVAQTQGELGYLLAEALDGRLAVGSCAALLTRVVIDANDAGVRPSKPIGPVLAARPDACDAVRLPDGSGWRRVVPSPRPTAVVEAPAIRILLETTHVIAGGGGGIAVRPSGGARRPVAAVVDKDWTAALLAVQLGAERLLYVTDVPHCCDAFGRAEQRPIRTMSVSAARLRLGAGAFAPGSMGPKVASAVDFVAATGRPAVIAALGRVESALLGSTGTTITPA